MIIVGLTGGIGSGKSTVADIFAKAGVTVIDTDTIARSLVDINKPAYLKIIHVFSKEILLNDGNLDRSALKQRIINDAEDRLKLESILHPLIQQEATKLIGGATGHYCIIVIPLLAEKANYPMLNRILVVDTMVSQQIERIAQRDDLDNSSIERLISIQASREQRLAIADDVILNEQGIDELTAATLQMHDKYLKL